MPCRAHSESGRAYYLLLDHVGFAKRVASVTPRAGFGAHLDAACPVWTVDDVRQRLEEAGRTLMLLPIPKHGFPDRVRSHWPDTFSQMEDVFIALVGAAEQVKQDFARSHNTVRMTPSARDVARMDEALEWLWRISDPRKRRLCMARALIHPVSDRHIASYRKLGRLFGLHHDTVRAWHDRTLSQLSQALTRDRVPKKRAGRRAKRLSRGGETADN